LQHLPSRIPNSKAERKEREKENSQMPSLMTNETSYQASGRAARASLCKCPGQKGWEIKIGIKKILIALFLVLGCTCVQAQTYRSISVRTPDNITIAAQEWGNPKGPEIVFIHGLGQSHLSWMKQYESSLAKEFRILTYDLRGHGDSEKPSEPNMYSEGKRWGDDLKAVLSAAGFKKPTLVAWSLGAVVVLNYLHTYGGKDLSGVVFVDAIFGTKFEFMSVKFFPPLVADDLLERSTAIANLLRACFHKQPDQNDFELMLTYNAMVPVVTHRALRQFLTIEGSEELLKSLKLPVLIIHGEKDSLVTTSMALYGHGLLQNSEIKMYSDSGHSPFFEEPARFNTDLQSFVIGTEGQH
jgi:non-heme chloroperoxidase